MIKAYKEGKLSYDDLFASTDGWLAYARNANTFCLRKNITAKIEEQFPGHISSIEIDRWLKRYR